MESTDQSSLSYIADRYAETLTKYDVQTLFEWLKQKYGNLSKASKALGIQRKTVYDWEKNSEDLKVLTKRKILKTGLELDPDRAMSFLVEKSSANFEEILQRQMSFIYRKILGSKEAKDCSNYLLIFEKNRNLYRTDLLGTDSHQTNHMIDTINQKAESFGLDGVKPSMRNMVPERLAESCIHLVEVLRENRFPRNEIVDLFELPSDFINSVCDACDYVDPPVSPADYPLPKRAGYGPAVLDERKSDYHLPKGRDYSQDFGPETDPFGKLYALRSKRK